MEDELLDLVGRILVTRVRDKTIEEWDRTVAGEMKDEESKAIFAALSKFDNDQMHFFKRLIPKIVDNTLHHLLWTIEQSETIDLTVKTSSGKFESIREISDGLTGEMYTEDGWIVRFSKQRYEEWPTEW